MFENPPFACNRYWRSLGKSCSVWKRGLETINKTRKHTIQQAYVPGVPGVLGIPGAERSGAVWEQSRKHTYKQSDKQKGKRRKRKTHKHSIKQNINQANNKTSTPSIQANEQQRKKTKKPQRRNLI